MQFSTKVLGLTLHPYDYSVVITIHELQSAIDSANKKIDIIEREESA